MVLSQGQVFNPLWFSAHVKYKVACYTAAVGGYGLDANSTAGYLADTWVYGIR
jgi:hypothetical protein